MEVTYQWEHFKKLSNAVVTIGTFDGLHKGHQKILNRVKEEARQTGGTSVVITLWPHPRKVLQPELESVKMLYSLDERIALLKASGIEHLVVIEFTKAFSQTTSEEFISNILVNTIGTKKLIIGYDHRFGNNREGGFDYLQANASRYGFEVEEIPRQDIDDMAISSSKIRAAILSADMETATSLLGKEFSIQGKVVKGEQLGRKIGFPTANILVEEEDKIIPKDGVYAVNVLHKGTSYKGMMNIGYRPTVEGKKRTIEVHLLDFDEEIYGEQLVVSFVQYLRAEQKFDGLEGLITQLHKDKLRTQEILAQFPLV